MIRSRALLAMLGLPGVLVAACGGAVVATDPESGAREDTPSRGPSPPRRPLDASVRDVAVDVAPGDCACTDEIVQIEGTCSFTIAPRLVSCVAEHSADAGYVTLDLWRSCLTSNAPPSWSPSAKTTELDLCSCVPGEKHALCVRYL